ncbi:MAG: hypothetical protein ACK5O2_13015, partial [Microthrixaceae bacterium]
MAVVLAAGSAPATGASAQDRPAVGVKVGSPLLGVYDSVEPALARVVGSDVAGAVVVAARAYDEPTFPRVGVGVSTATDNPFSQVHVGEGGGVSQGVGLEVTSTTHSVLTYTPSGTGQRIYRAVEPDELADLMGSGQYRNIPGIGDGKYFFPTRQQADAFAEMMTKRGMGGPDCTTSRCIPADVMRLVERIYPAG